MGVLWALAIWTRRDISDVYKRQVYGNLTQQAGGEGREQGLLATMYWIDVTDSEEIARKYRAVSYTHLPLLRHGDG